MTVYCTKELIYENFVLSNLMKLKQGQSNRKGKKGTDNAGREDDHNTDENNLKALIGSKKGALISTETLSCNVNHGRIGDSIALTILRKCEGKVFDKMFTPAGSGFALVVIGSFARNLVLAFYLDHQQHIHFGGESNSHNANVGVGHDGSNSDSAPIWVDVVCGDRCVELIGNCSNVNGKQTSLIMHGSKNGLLDNMNLDFSYDSGDEWWGNMITPVVSDVTDVDFIECISELIVNYRLWVKFWHSCIAFVMGFFMLILYSKLIFGT
ncbi:hypothetical protein RJT34_25089 [Clitoria ternatea]|uniref:Uncharacterized protein n=1 Tax=Clitoria ternatea TaxID=43366 RepID=A0AAN9II65_CLITE